MASDPDVFYCIQTVTDSFTHCKLNTLTASVIVMKADTLILILCFSAFSNEAQQSLILMCHLCITLQ